MLRIVEYNKITGKKVDLKELESFGFEYKENKRIPQNSIWNYEDYLEVKGNKEQIYIRAFDNREITVFSSCGKAIDKLYDLIVAGYVEKSGGGVNDKYYKRNIILDSNIEWFDMYYIIIYMFII